ncbi:CpaD family pilus assembly lipoprotein [Magnetospira sp. QH-2]|uniref:CpaD family pilus assembly lipoprotein n=1 Tax=Magnetospira sp. (strain QH-2) TaxID=1288970 RepID=UPI0003E81314|nr:CpaD family pilus assembly lipoprotein [Magnetospira sp. QH-2]CCQ73551.1 Exported protein of unknown function CpaD-C [Magnetospira sp. QH-2]
MSIKRTLTASVSALALLVLGGCQTLESLALSGAMFGGKYLHDQYKDGDWDNVQPEKALSVTPIDMAHRVKFDSRDATLLGEELAALDDFLARIRLETTDEVSIPLTSAHDLSRRRAEAVAAYLGSRRIDARIIESRVNGDEFDMVRIDVRRHLVTLPPCPDWTGAPGNNLDNQVMTNHGCASATNLGLMVADPRDLVAGRQMGPADGEYLASGIDRYRRGETKPLDGSASSGDSGGSDLMDALGGGSGE